MKVIQWSVLIKPWGGQIQKQRKGQSCNDYSKKTQIQKNNQLISNYFDNHLIIKVMFMQKWQKRLFKSLGLTKEDIFRHYLGH